MNISLESFPSPLSMVTIVIVASLDSHILALCGLHLVLSHGSHLRVFLGLSSSLAMKFFFQVISTHLDQADY